MADLISDAAALARLARRIERTAAELHHTWHSPATALPQPPTGTTDLAAVCRTHTMLAEQATIAIGHLIAELVDVTENLYLAAAEHQRADDTAATLLAATAPGR